MTNFAKKQKKYDFSYEANFHTWEGGGGKVQPKHENGVRWGGGLQRPNIA